VDPLLDSKRHSFVHTGRLSLSGVSLRPLLDGLRLASVESDDRFEVVFAGSVTEEERLQLAAPDLAETVRFAGWLERERALALQRAADTLLLVTEGAGRRSVATGKLFEYLAAGRPILVLGDQTEAARIVAEAVAGIAAPADDPRAIAEAVRSAVVEPLAAPAAEGRRDYAYPVLVERLAGVIERVATRPAAAGR